MNTADLKQPAKAAIAAVGGGTEMARQLGITKSAVSQWRKVPVERVSQVAKLTGIPPHGLRPDIWRPGQGPPDSAASDNAQ